MLAWTDGIVTLTHQERPAYLRGTAVDPFRCQPAALTFLLTECPVVLGDPTGASCGAARGQVGEYRRIGHAPSLPGTVLGLAGQGRSLSHTSASPSTMAAGDLSTQPRRRSRVHAELLMIGSLQRPWLSWPSFSRLLGSLIGGYGAATRITSEKERSPDFLGRHIVDSARPPRSRYVPSLMPATMASLDPPYYDSDVHHRPVHARVPAQSLPGGELCTY